MPGCRGGLCKLPLVEESNDVRGIITRFYSAWSAGRKIRVDVLRAASAIIRCRTEHLGSHLESCDCGHVSDLKFNSCRHRSCPQCRGGRRADWLHQATNDLLPCDHAHIIFTVPEQLNILWQFNRSLFGDTLMMAARESLEELLADPKYLGAKPGIISVLHTWGRNLSIHPHVHCLVSAGGIDSDGQFVTSWRSVLVPARVLHAVFRGKLCDFLRKAVASGELVIPTLMTAAKCHSLLNRMGRVRWNVRLQERYPHGVSVAGYLARYMAGGPISDSRICSVTDSQVVFRYRDHRDGVEKRMKLTPEEFLSRWFEHVPPRQLRMIRRSGLYANCNGAVRQTIRAQLTSISPAESTAEPRAAAAQVPALDPPRCPRCNTCVTVRSVYHPPLVFAPVRFAVRRKSRLPQPP
jgi:hypothetical protein